MFIGEAIFPYIASQSILQHQQTHTHTQSCCCKDGAAAGFSARWKTCIVLLVMHCLNARFLKKMFLPS